MTNKNNKKGFTIIEVVLVLAIAGLIFLMVFIALPALQRSQRNTRRRQDMARILSAFNDYQANNNGNFPNPDTAGDMEKFAKKYVDPSCTLDTNNNLSGCADQFVDPDGTQYTIIKGDSQESKADNVDHNIRFYTSAKCNGEAATSDAKYGTRSIAITYVLEGGAVYCGDNQ
jgi:prepilin-type N-terminal cleavage/methylation domain-containing protein